MKRHATGKLRFFSMVEVALATAIVGFGFASIMALFPIGVVASRDAMAETYSSEIGDQLIHHFETQARKTGHWSTAIDAMPATRPAPPAAQVGNPTGTALDTDGTIYDLGSCTYRVIRYTRPDSTVTGPYDSTKDYLDFDAIVMVWKSQITVGGTMLDYAKGATLNVEISWISQKAPGDRTSSFYCKDIFAR